MQYASGRPGRIFYLRLDHDEDLLTVLQNFVSSHKIHAGIVHLIGAISGGTLVTGPKETTLPPDPVWHQLEGAHELVGTVMIRSDNQGPVLHLHATAGRGTESITGCFRKGTTVYIVVEAVIIEFEGFTLGMENDTQTGLRLPVPGNTSL